MDLPTLFILIFIALASGAISLLIWLLVWRAGRAGRARVRGMTFDRQSQPFLFWLVLAFYAFAAITSGCFSIFLLGVLAL